MANAAAAAAAAVAISRGEQEPGNTAGPGHHAPLLLRLLLAGPPLLPPTAAAAAAAATAASVSEGRLVAAQLGLLHVRRDPLALAHLVARPQRQRESRLRGEPPPHGVLVPREPPLRAARRLKGVDGLGGVLLEGPVQPNFFVCCYYYQSYVST